MLEGLYWALFFSGGAIAGIFAGWFLLMGARHHSQNMYKNLMQQQQQQEQEQQEPKKPVVETDNRKYYGVREAMERLNKEDPDEDT